MIEKSIKIINIEAKKCLLKLPKATLYQGIAILDLTREKITLIISDISQKKPLANASQRGGNLGKIVLELFTICSSLLQRFALGTINLQNKYK